jgi:CheY-like chemotaxis protein
VASKRILIVDDEFTVADTLAEYLAWEGYTTTIAANGKAALEAISSARPDLVLLDFMMPVMDGLQLLAALREQPATRELPVILMTAAPAAITGSITGHQALLVKPFDARKMMQHVRRLLGD